MPEIGSLQVGSYRAHLLNDSAGLRRGTNTLTVHIPDLPPGGDLTLRLHGPGGELIDVPLRPLRVLSGPAAGHAVGPTAAAAGAGDGSAPAPAGVSGAGDHARHQDPHAHREAPAGETVSASHSHAPSQHSHGSDVGSGNAAAHASDEATEAGSTRAEAPGGHGAAAHGGAAVFSGFAARGAVRLPATGAWRAVLTAGDGRGERVTGELALGVTADGPNLLLLGFLGFLSGGSVLYGWTHRRRAESRN